MVRRVPLFTKCGECDRLREAVRVDATQETDTTEFLSNLDAHNTFFAEERRTYSMNMELPKSDPGCYIYLVVDGADHANFSLPHFTTHTIDERVHGLPVHIIGLLLHASVSQFRLFTMTDGHATGANHVI